MEDVICECCGSGDTTSSLEEVGGYDERLPVISCYACDFSYYQEPIENKQ